eukprot:2064467-Rhodomonas_salina.1
MSLSRAQTRSSTDTSLIGKKDEGAYILVVQLRVRLVQLGRLVVGCARSFHLPAAHPVSAPGITTRMRGRKNGRMLRASEPNERGKKGVCVESVQGTEMRRNMQPPSS